MIKIKSVPYVSILPQGRDSGSQWPSMGGLQAGRSLVAIVTRGSITSQSWSLLPRPSLELSMGQWVHFQMQQFCILPVAARFPPSHFPVPSAVWPSASTPPCPIGYPHHHQVRVTLLWDSFPLSPDSRGHGGLSERAQLSPLWGLGRLQRE